MATRTMQAVGPLDVDAFVGQVSSGAGVRRRGELLGRGEESVSGVLGGLARVLEGVGGTLLELVLGDAHSAARVGEVVIHDRHDESLPPAHSLVLGVGVRDPGEVAVLLDRLGQAGSAALVVRAPFVVSDAVRAAAARSGVAVLTLGPGAAWAQVAALLRSVLAEGEVGASGAGTIAGVPAGDLFAVANAISELVDAPITIEDLSYRVLAFSGNQDEADEPRMQAVLGRRTPARFLQALEERGVFAELYHSEDPIYVELPGIAWPRLAVAVRAGDETLGSIWAALRERPTAERERALAESAKLVALHLLRRRAFADVERRLRAELVATVLEGGPGAYESARRLHIAPSAAVVLALGIDTAAASSSSAHAEAERQRIADALALHLAAVHPGAASALIGGTIYAILPIPPDLDDADHRAVRVATEFLERAGEGGRCAFGVGRIATTVTELAQSRLDADRALRVLRSEQASRRIVSIGDVYSTALLLELSDLVATDTEPPRGPLTELLRYDAKHQGQLVPSLTAWLDAFGDVNAAAAAVHVHPNTFRYRLRRVVEVGQINLDDPEQRFAIQLQLRLLRTTTSDNTEKPELLAVRSVS